MNWEHFASADKIKEPIIANACKDVFTFAFSKTTSKIPLTEENVIVPPPAAKKEEEESPVEEEAEMDVSDSDSESEAEEASDDDEWKRIDK